MRVNCLLLALPLLAVTAPVSAQDVVYVPGTGDDAYASDSAQAYDDPEVDEAGDAQLGQVAGQLSDPAVQDKVADMVERVSGAVMNMPIGGFTDAIESARPGTVKRRLRGNATLSDIAGRDSAYLPEELGDQSREMAAMTGGVARAMANIMPQIENLGRDVQEQMQAARQEARRTRNR